VSRVLIVDDDTGIRLLLTTFLRRHGFQTLQARNGREALDEMRAGNADLVIMDLMMPDVTGWDVLRERGRDLSLLRIPVIVLTAMNRNQVTADVAGKRVSAVVGKPFDLDTLLAAVTASLDHTDLPAPLAA
jgi:DNA-binding response OmpR family regulator